MHVLCFKFNKHVIITGYKDASTTNLLFRHEFENILKDIVHEKDTQIMEVLI